MIRDVIPLIRTWPPLAIDHGARASPGFPNRAANNRLVAAHLPQSGRRPAAPCSPGRAAPTSPPASAEGMVDGTLATAGTSRAPDRAWRGGLDGPQHGGKEGSACRWHAPDA